MKKKNLFGGALCVLTTGLIAQPTITMEDMMPTIGNSIEIAQTDYADAGEAGENLVWDFSELPVNLAASMVFELPENTMFGDQHPAATHASVSVSMDEYGYMKYADNKAEIVGAHQGPIAISYSEFRTQFSYPLTLGAEYEDTYSNTLVLGAGVTNVETGEIDATVDAYGTLHLPSGTYEDVMRVKLVNSGTVDVVYDGNVVTTTTFVETTYTFAKAGVPVSLLAFVEYAADEGSYVIGQMFHGETVGLEKLENRFDLKVYPSPAADVVNISLAPGVQGNATVKLLSAGGTVVLSKQMNARELTSLAYQLTLPKLSPGLYLVQINTTKGVATRKIVIE